MDEEDTVANEKHGQDGVSRREFATRVGAAAAAVAIGGSRVFGSEANVAPAVGRRVLGANDRVILASIGVRGQGNALKRGFARLKNVEHKTICDIDANVAAERINDPQLKDVPTFKPGYQQDLRRVMDDKDIDAVVRSEEHTSELQSLRQ